MCALPAPQPITERRLPMRARQVLYRFQIVRFTKPMHELLGPDERD
jgi:hypothetical protein